jgi:probable HAF family extracellular repeat protein
MIDLGTLGGSSSSAAALNNRGQVVGWSTTASGETHAFVWDNGVMIDLSPEKASSFASDINDRGEIVGSSGLFTPALWTKDRKALPAAIRSLPERTGQPPGLVDLLR